MESFTSPDLETTIKTAEQNIASKLKELRRSLGTSCADFAEALNLTKSELEAYEDNSEDIPASVIALVCALSGVPFSYFFGQDDENHTSTITNHSTVYHTTAKEEQPVLS
jgi:transcriptional regulator with XRE-family HTH domain